MSRLQEAISISDVDLMEVRSVLQEKPEDGRTFQKLARAEGRLALLAFVEDDSGYVTHKPVIEVSVN